jgi:hypothetical protein
MANDLQLYETCRPDESFVKQIFAYDARTLEQTDDLFISKCILGLSQYLVYFKSEYNKKLQQKSEKQRILEAALFQIVTPELIKQYKTKKDIRSDLVYTNPVLNKLQIDIEVLQDELFLLDGMDKTIQELIAAFKRELTRRENELYQRRKAG